MMHEMPATRFGHGGWIVRPSSFRGEGSPPGGERTTAATELSWWARDESNWSEMVRLYEAVTGETLRSPTKWRFDAVVKPALERALRRGLLAREGQSNVGASRTAGKSGEAGVYGKAPPKSGEPQPERSPAPPAKIVAARRIDEKTFVDVVIADKGGKPLSGRRYKLELPDGTMEEGRLASDGRLGKTNLDPGIARLTLLPEEGDTITAEDIAAS